MTTHRYKLKDFMARYVSESVSDVFAEILDALPKTTPDGPWLAGGALRRLISGQKQDSDFDFFFQSLGQFEKFCADIEKCGGKVIKETELYKTFRLSLEDLEVDHDNIIIQAVAVATYRTADEVLDSFDFTITQFAYDGKDLIVGEYALWDLARKRLALHKLTYGTATMRRIIKYTRQGFYACPGVMADILEAAADDPTSIKRSTEYVD